MRGRAPTQTLSALAVSVGSLTPAFDPATTAYTAAVGLFQTSATVTPTAADPGASITVDGSALASGAASATLALATGPNPVMIVVTAADGRHNIELHRRLHARGHGHGRSLPQGLQHRRGRPVPGVRRAGPSGRHPWS